MFLSDDLFHWTGHGSLLGDDTGFEAADSYAYTGFFGASIWPLPSAAAAPVAVNGDKDEDEDEDSAGDFLLLTRAAYRGARDASSPNRALAKQLLGLGGLVGAPAGEALDVPGNNLAGNIGQHTGGHAAASIALLPGAPALLDVSGINFEIKQLAVNATAFSDRDYVWSHVPSAFLPGGEWSDAGSSWNFTQIAGGFSFSNLPQIRAMVLRSGYCFAAVGTNEENVPGMQRLGWFPVGFRWPATAQPSE